MNFWKFVNFVNISPVKILHCMIYLVLYVIFNPSHFQYVAVYKLKHFTSHCIARGFCCMGNWKTRNAMQNNQNQLKHHYFCECYHVCVYFPPFYHFFAILYESLMVSKVSSFMHLILSLQRLPMTMLRLTE